jgi:serine/threonine-protein kinase
MPDRILHFGPFALDTSAGELVRGRKRVRLQDKPLRVLIALVERPGTVVPREELRARLWPPGMVVEFDDGLNTAINKLRHALGDSAATPRYIETVGRRGYRFIGELASSSPRSEPAPSAAPIELTNTPGTRPSMTRRRLALAGAIAVVTAGAILAAILPRAFDPPRDSSPVTRFTVVVPSAHRIEMGAYQSVAISPSGAHLAYLANGRIYVRPRDSAEARPVAGTEDQGPLLGVLFSPDSRWIGFYSSRHRELRKVPLDGGTPIRVAAAQSYLGGTWGADGKIVFAQAAGVFAAADSGGEPETLFTVQHERGERARNPVLLPGGRAVLFTLATGSRSYAAAQVLAGGPRVLLATGTDARYVSTGHLLYAEAGYLTLAPFDADALQITGPHWPLANRVWEQGVIGAADFTVSPDGTLVYRSFERPPQTLLWVDREGRQEPLGVPPLPYSFARVSPDGENITVSIDDEEGAVFVWNVPSRTLSQLTFNTVSSWAPIWTPDGRRIVFASLGPRRNISWKNADGTGAAELLLDSGTDLAVPNSVDPTGSWLVYRRPTFVSSSGIQDNDLWVLRLDSTRPAEPLLATEQQELNGEISPDGRWLAYQSNETGAFEVYLRPFPDAERAHWQVSTGGGFQPAWNPDGTELYYLDSRRLLAARIAPGDAPTVAATRVVLDALPYAPYERSSRTYDIAPDGQRFLFTSTAPTVSDRPFQGAERYEVVLNWTEELEALVPGR